jgi:hypothetical protein
VRGDRDLSKQENLNFKMKARDYSADERQPLDSLIKRHEEVTERINNSLARPFPKQQRPLERIQAGH